MTRVLAFSATFLLLACTPRSDAELLEVYGVAPTEVAPGQALEVRGRGFPPGRSARVRLRGRFHPPGRSMRRVELELEGRAISPELIEARFTEEALTSLGGRGTLRGRVRVAFAAHEHGSVTGRSPPIVLDVMPPSTNGLGEELARRARASELLDSIGLSVGEETPDEDGLPIELVADDTTAAEIGLVPTDRVVALDGVRTHSLSDFVPPPNEDDAQLEVARHGEAAPFHIRIPVTGRRDGRASAVRNEQATLVWVLLVLLLVAPSASIADRLVRPREPLAQAATARRALLLAIARTAIAFSFLFLYAALDHLAHVHVALELVVIAIAVGRAISALSTLESSRVRSLLRALAGVVLVTIAIGCASALGGTTELGALHSLQGMAPWQWTALRSPAGPMLAALLVIGGGFRGTRSRIAAILDESAALVVAAIGAAVLFGGWRAETDLAWQVAGALAFATKGFLLYACMRRIGAGEPSRAQIAAVAILASSAIAITVVWLLWEPAEELESALAQALSTTAIVAAAWYLARRFAVKPRRAALAHPFL